MIEIEGPDGVIYEFPEGTSEDVMRGALQKVYGAPTAQPEAAPGQSPAMAEGLAALSDTTRNPPPPERGLGQIAYDNLVGDPNDGVQSYGEQLGTWLNRAGESMTLGLIGDEASAAAYAPIKNALSPTGLTDATSYDEELARFRGNEEGMSTLGRLSADIGGAILPVFLSAGAAAAPNALGRASSLAAKVAPSNIAANFIGRAGSGVGSAIRGGAAGAVMGGAQGFMEGEDTYGNRLGDAGLGAFIGAGVGAAAAGIGNALGDTIQKRAARKYVAEAAKKGRTTDELRAAGNALYDEVDRAGVQIRPEAFDRLRSDALDRLRANTGFDELPGPGSLTPNASRAMEIMGQASGRMSSEPTAALPFKSLDQMRRQAGAAAGNIGNKTDQSAGMQIIETLDDFIERLGPDDVLAGDVQALQGAILKAREVWGQMSRSQKIDDAIEAGGDYMSGASSGIRNQFKNLLRNPKRLRGFSDTEKAVMRQVVNGGPLEQLINLVGGGQAQLMSMIGGAYSGGVPGFIAGSALASGQRKLQETMTTAAAERARAAIASGLLRGPEMAERIGSSGQVQNMLGLTGILGTIPTATNALRPQ